MTMSFLEELKRRNVVKVGMLYVVASWLILQVADVLFEAMNLPSVWLRLVLAILILGFPLALIFSWVFEMTPEGIKRERDIDRSSSITQQTGRKVNTLIVVLLVLAIAAVVVDRLIPETAVTSDREAAVDKRDGVTPAVESAVPVETGPVGEDASIGNDKSVAVLPFANRSANEADVYFVDGIHDDILTQLARIGDLKVISRTSVEKFRNTSQSMGEIGDALGVKNILEGGVQRAGDRVRINVQLIDVETDKHLWADTYDRELTTENIFAIQSEISTAIAEALRATLSPEEKAQLATEQTQNLEAMEAYFLGRQAMARRTSSSLAEAEEHFKRAIELDPNYALVYVALADTYSLQATYSGKSAEGQARLGEPLILKALAINDRLGEAYISLAETVPFVSPAESAEDLGTLYRKGIELAPGYATGHHWYGIWLVGEGRFEEGVERLRQAVRLDPLAPVLRTSLGSVLESLGRFDEASMEYESSIRLDPGFANGHSRLGRMEWLVNGRVDNALVHMHKAVELDPGNPGNVFDLVLMRTDIGEWDQTDQLLERVFAIDSEFFSHLAPMLVNLNRGRAADVVADAEQLIAIDESDIGALYVLGLNDRRNGEAERAVQRYRDAFPQWFEDAGPEIRQNNFVSAVFLAFFLREAGDELRSGLLLDRSLAFMQALPRVGGSGYAPFKAYAFAVRGDKRESLAALRAAVDDGWRNVWRLLLKYDPVFATLHEAPEYKAIVAEIEADMAAQLANVRAMEARGELAPLPPLPAR